MRTINVHKVNETPLLEGQEIFLLKNDTVSLARIEYIYEVVNDTNRFYLYFSDRPQPPNTKLIYINEYTGEEITTKDEYIKVADLIK